MHVEWMRRYKNLTESYKIRPFTELVPFLTWPGWLNQAWFQRSALTHADPRNMQQEAIQCQEEHVIQRNSHNHKTEDCFTFKMLVERREPAIRKARRCCKLFQQHFKTDCRSNSPVCLCGHDHHLLLCRGMVKKVSLKGAPTWQKRRHRR